MEYREEDNMLSLLETLMPPSTESVRRKIADDFRKRRIEKNLTREEISAKAGISVSNVIRFERTGQISLTNLIELAIAMGYVSNLSSLFSTAHFTTLDELETIRHNSTRTKAYPKK